MPSDVHRFPVLGEDTNPASNLSRKISSAFQPLVEVQASTFNPRIQLNSSSSDEDADAANVQKCQIRLQEGTEAGRSEGKILAREKFSPDLNDFMDMRIKLSDQIQRLVQSTANQTIALSIAMVQSVLGAEVQLSREDLEPLLPDLRQALTTAYRPTLRLSASDLELLHEMVKVVEYYNLDALSEISIDADATPGKGRLHIEHHRLNSLALAEQMISGLTAILENSLPAEA